MKLNATSLVALFLVMFAFFFVLTCLDFFLMTHFDYWRDPNSWYTYWIVLSLIVLVFGFGLAFMGYVSGLETWACAALFSTVILLFAGGLLDQFYQILAFLQGYSYSWSVWSFGYKVFVMNGILGSWGWFEQAVWSTIFYGAIVAIWYRVLRRS